jgi:hypothetical protein
VLRITETTISRDGLVSRPLTRAERRELTRAIRGLNAAYFRKHPFTGTCPIAYDGTESIYRFRGFPLRLASCRFDVQGVPAVELTERLLATLKRRG